MTWIWTRERLPADKWVPRGDLLRWRLHKITYGHGSGSNTCAKPLEHYHRRSIVESTFSMLKATFGETLRSKGDTAQINELLCKVLCQNIRCVIQSMYELDIEAEFPPR